MYYCFICDTPYHLLNCINLYSHLRNEFTQSDIIIGDSFRDSEQIIKRLEDTNFFNHVIRFHTLRAHVEARAWFVSKIKEILWPKVYLQDWTHNKIDFSRKYTDLYFAYNNSIVCAMRQVFCNANMHMYEDGTSTYLGYVLGVGKGRSILYKLAGKTTLLSQTFDIWLNNVDVYQRLHPENKKRIYQLPTLNIEDSRINDLVNYVFDVAKTSSYQSNHIVYLTQPYDLMTNRKKANVKKFSQIEQKLLNTLDKYNSDLVVRVHPRQSVNGYEQFNIDRDNNVWELLCMSDISNQHILISFCSTAQLVPKCFFGKEPYLIFLYPLVKFGLNNNRLSEIRNLTNTVRSLYNEKNKIFFAHNVGEVDLIIEKIKRECLREF
jgi:hypothetical protein